jgi:acetoin utilization deacetylase AcuC-like enzyme
MLLILSLLLPPLLPLLSLMLLVLLQDGNYPKTSGTTAEVGTGAGVGFNINIPLPPGSGEGAYSTAFTRVVEPAVHAFAPDIILVSSGECYQ